jgi:hypothetical protein
LLPNMVELIKKAAIDAIEQSNPTSILYGTVVEENPLKINIEQKLTLDSDYLLLTDNVRDYSTKESSGNPEIENEITIYNRLKKDEQVLLVQLQGGQKYVVLNRLVKA